MNLDQQLAEVSLLPSQNWGKALSISKKQFDEWVIRKLYSQGYHEFKIAYIPVLVNIGPEGTGNKELAQRTRVTKQAVSKVLKDLEDYGYITSKPAKDDKRNSIISLTDKGKKLVIASRICMRELMDDYRREFGAKEFDHLLLMLQRMIEYNDRKLLK